MKLRTTLTFGALAVLAGCDHPPPGEDSKASASRLQGDGCTIPPPPLVGPAPQVVGRIEVNAGLPAFTPPPPSVAVQHSRVVNLRMTFDSPVALDPGAVTLALHPNVTYGGVALASKGAIPTVISTLGADKKTLTVTFSGSNTAPLSNGANDGKASLVDGVYDMKLDGTKVHLDGAPSVRMVGDATLTFHRLFGDTGDPDVSVAGVRTAIVSSGENLDFRTAFNRSAGDPLYVTYLDADGSGNINTGDNFEFRNRFNVALSWE